MTAVVQPGRNLEIFSLLWLDAVDDDSLETVEAQQCLRASINHMKTFHNGDECIQYIQSEPEDRFVIVVSGRLGPEIVPRVHSLRQVYSIYVHSSDRKQNERWTKCYAKIKGVFIDWNVLVNEVRSNHEKRRQTEINEPLPVTFFSTQTANNKEANEHFVYSQLLVDYFLHVEPIATDKKELITLCTEEYHGNDSELGIVREFDNDYSPDRALWWFTRDTFLSRLLSKAFRVHNIDLLLMFRFLIRDMQQLIAKNKCAHSVCVYRSYLMSAAELDSFKKLIGEFLSVHEYFITNIYRQQTIEHLWSSGVNNELEKVLFEIFADPQVDPHKPYCNITPFSFCTGEDQIMFTVGSIFRLVSVHQQEDGQERIWIIRMKLSTNKHKRLKFYLEPMKNRYSTEPMDVLSLGRVLRKMCKFDEAEIFYRRVLSELSADHDSVPDCHYELALVTAEKGDYEASLKWHQKAIALQEQTMDTDDPALGHHYNSIANTYQKKGEYQQALEYYRRAMLIWKRAFGDVDLGIAMCLNNMGCVYEIEKKYYKALECHQKALIIKNHHLPSDHLSLSATHTNLATVYGCLRQWNSALEHLHLALNIRLKSLPARHLDIALTWKNIGLVHELKGNFAQAKGNYQKASAIRRHVLLPTHPDVVRIEQDIQRVSSKIT